MQLADRRISLDPSPKAVQGSDLEVVFVGHCPGRCRWRRLSAEARDEIRLLGYGRRIRLLEEESPAEEPDLFHLPLPIRSLADFEALFPDARTTPTRYTSRLAGDRAWLPVALEHFFTASGELPSGANRIWVIPVPEDPEPEVVEQDASLEAFLPKRQRVDLSQPEGLQGAEAALLIPAAGLLVLPDLERISIPRSVENPHRVRLANPDPGFTPCSSRYDDSHRERNNPDEMEGAEEPITFTSTLLQLSVLLDRYRPDMQALLPLPISSSQELKSGRLNSGTLALVQTAIDKGLPLHRLQLLYPYLRQPDLSLTTPSGALAGTIARVTHKLGPWRSVAGRPLAPALPPFPSLSIPYAAQLRDKPGLGILVNRQGKLMLDDERLAATDLSNRRYSRSAEAVRFMGFLVRSLRRLGEQLVFNVDPQDPRPRMVLEDFFTRLHERGALAGANPEDAFTISQLPVGSSENHLEFEIEISPALPIDHIRLTFSHSRNPDQPDWRLEVQSG